MKVMKHLTVRPAAYRKGYSVLQTPGDGSGFKTATMWAIEKLGGQWVHRYKGYVLPTGKAQHAARVIGRLLRRKAA